LQEARVKTTILRHSPALIAETAEASPAVCGIGDEIWVAWVEPTAARTLWVAHGAALTPDAFHVADRVAVATGAEPVVGLCFLDQKLYLAWSQKGGGIYLACCADGKIWGAPVTAPAPLAWGGVSLAAHHGALFIAFHDATTDCAAITSSDGAAFGPVTPLGVRTNSVPALAPVEDPFALPALHVAVATDTGTIVASRCHAGGVSSLAGDFLEVGLAGSAVTLAPMRVDHAAGLALGVLAPGGCTIATAAVVADPPYLKVARADPVGAPGIADVPRLTTVDGELCLGYRDASSQVVVACYVHACTLDPNDPRINQPCDPATCPPDPRLVCALKPSHAIRWQPATIENAQKGDLVLTAADGIGVIGTLLGALSPPQIYDHMGIMVEDKRVIRHCTESKDRLKDKRYYTGMIAFDAAPSEGLRPDHLTYGWPGIIQQTVEDAFYTGLRGPYNAEWSMEARSGGTPAPIKPEFLAVSPGERSQFPDVWDSLRFVDPEDTGTSEIYRYEIKNLPANPALRQSDGELLWPMVVRPPVDAETTMPWVRPLLHRVADASLTLRAHYRFYAYTRSAIAIDGSKDPPPKSDPSWSDITQDVEVPDNSANGYHIERQPILGVDWAVGTHPMVCSTFVWASVRQAEKTLRRKIELEGPVEALDNDGQPHRPAGSQDGLYYYSEDERKNSAVTLHKALEKEVHQNTDESASGFEGLIADFLVWAADMADDVATQTVNAFAVDRADEKDDDLWKQPGEGNAVGPDDILRNWDAPTGADNETCRGLYGDRVPANLVQGAYVWTQDFGYALANGMAHVRARFSFTDPFTGALRIMPVLVTIGCESGYTDKRGTFSALIGAGDVLIKATAWDTVLGVHLSHEGATTLTEGVNNLHLTLNAPPLWRRRIVWSGETHIYHNPDVGDKQVNTAPFAENWVLAWDPDVMNNNPKPNVVDYMTHFVIGGNSVKYDGHYVTYSVDIRLLQDGSIDYDGEFCFFVDGDKQDNLTKHLKDNILPDGFRDLKYEANHDAFLDSHDYGRVALTIRNQWAKY
jgi:hypothetical protein